jgi:excisionase family DNA binding protein
MGASSKGETMAEVRTAVRSNEYLRTADVARVLHVSTKTVSRWANDKKLPYMRTLGGHRRYPAQAIHQLAEGLVGRS